MKVCLINPPFLFPYHTPRESQVIGLRSLSAALKQQGHQVQFLDGHHLGLHYVMPYANGVRIGLDLPKIRDLIEPDVDMAAVSAPFSQLAPVVHDLIGLIKEKRPELEVVMGGIYPSAQPELALTSGADCIVLGEGETALCRLAEGQAPDDIPGVGRPGQAPPFSHAPLADIDSLPLPDRDIPDFAGYLEQEPGEPGHKRGVLHTSRGCPFACNFCSIGPVYGRQWRGRKAEAVLEEVRILNRDHGVDHFELEDDNFTMKPERAHKIMTGFIRLGQEGRPISWETPNGLRIDTLTPELMEAMVKAGPSSLTMALEHGDPEMLALMNKKLDLGQALAAIERFLALGLGKLNILIIVGYPGETRQRFERGMQIYRRIKAMAGGRVEFFVNIAQPLPGTRLLEQARANGWLVDPDAGNFLKTRNITNAACTLPLATEDFTPQEVAKRFETIVDLNPRPWPARIVRALLPARAWRSLRFLKNRSLT